MSHKNNLLELMEIGILEGVLSAMDEESGKWRRRIYAEEIDALRHARELTFMEPGQIVRFEYDGRNVYGIFYGQSSKGAFEVFWFAKEHGGLVRATLSPNSILDILSFEELEKRLA